MTYTVICPACDAELEIEADPAELAQESGTLTDCSECKETEIEFDYDPETDTLTATPGQYEEDNDEPEMCDVCEKPIDECDCWEDEDDVEN